MLSLFDLDFQQIGESVEVSSSPIPLRDEGGDLALWQRPDGSQALAVGWTTFTSGDNDPEQSEVYLRAFDLEGQPLGPPVQVNEPTEGAEKGPALASSGSGHLVVVWNSPDDGSFEGVRARRIGADGLPIGEEIAVNTTTLSQQLGPSVAMDPHGNFFVAWESFCPEGLLCAGSSDFLARWDIRGQLFRADGSRVAGEVIVNQVEDNDQQLVHVAFSDIGVLVAGWMSFGQGSSLSSEDAAARRWAASPRDELCWLHGGALACDLGHTGGGAELGRWVAWAGGGVPLLGDFDGDGREDLCSWSAGVFRCDLDHEGRPLEGWTAFGQAGDVPLLGDVDGDGRADPCVRRKRRLLCDTARDGGFAEQRMVLGGGTADEVPFLGDLDLDGREDLCLWLGDASTWHCRTWGGEERFLAATAGTPLMADVEGDARPELCTVAENQLRCRPSDGQQLLSFTLPLDLPTAGARLLAGNLDGL